MRVSFNQPHKQVLDSTGYGYAAKMCKESLLTLGHEVDWRWADADVEINFIQPDYWTWSGPDYRIGYLPWESTMFRDGWVEAMNDTDEMWTPSEFVANLMESNGVTVPIRIYEHGVESIWSPSPRLPAGTFDVFHHGAEALRKGGHETMNVFRDVLWQEDAILHMKMLLRGFPTDINTKIQVYADKLPIDELVSLYKHMDLMLYPSWGEGFGLTPLQAMATGMPVLINGGWAPYQNLLEDDSVIQSRLVASPWPLQHPGLMFQPDVDDMKDKLKWHHENREYTTKRALDLSRRVHKEYDWVDLTRRAFEHLL